MSQSPSTPDEVAHEVSDSTAMDVGVRVGFVAHGVVHLLVAWLAVRLAIGEGGQPSNDGALRELASQPVGGLLVWAIALALVPLVVWRLVEAWVGDPDEQSDVKRLVKRAGQLGMALVYAALSFTAVRVALGAGGGSGNSEETWASRLLSAPAGQALVVLLGVAIVATGLVLVWRGVTTGFADQLEGEGRSGADGRFYLFLGRVGHVAKGVAFAIMGGLFVYAGFSSRAREAGGLDDALSLLREAPFGPLILVVVGVGIGAYGLYDFARARHRND